MQHPVARYTVLALGVIACVLLMVPVLPFLVDARGVVGPAAGNAMHPVAAAVALAGGAAACCVVACVVGRLINAAVGLFVLGCGLMVVSGRSGTILDAAFGGDLLLPIAIETLAWSLAVALMSAIVFRVSGPLPDMPARTRGGPFVGEVWNADALRGLAAGLAAVVAVWFFARTDLKGQAIGAMVAGGIATAFAGRRLLGDSQPILLMAAPVVAVGLAQLATALAFKGQLDQSVAQGVLPGWSVAMPIDVACGALIGVPIGLGWSKSGEFEDTIGALD
jgi:hypothetical protein